jgi:hypothetical protein
MGGQMADGNVKKKERGRGETEDDRSRKRTVTVGGRAGGWAEKALGG